MGRAGVGRRVSLNLLSRRGLLAGLTSVAAIPARAATAAIEVATPMAAPGWAVGATFPLQPSRPLRDVARVEGTRLIYNRALAVEEVFSTPFPSGEGGAYDVHVTDARGAGYRVRGDRLLASLQLWSIPRTVSLEPFTSLEASPGEVVTWTYTYSYSAAFERQPRR